MIDGIECCGSEQNSNFCPSCGKKLRDKNEGILGLLAHCERTAENKKKCSVLHANPSDHDRKRTERERIAASKWKSWACELRKLMETTGNNHGH